MNKWLKQLAGIFFIMVLLSSMHVAATTGVASVLAYPATTKVRQFTQGEIKWNTVNWSKLENYLAEAIPYDQGNPELLRDMAFVLEQQKQPGKDDLINNLYNQSLILRPTWPYIWMDISMYEYSTKKDFNVAWPLLKQALSSGSWEPSIQKTVIHIGLHEWFNISIDDRKYTRDIVQRAMQVTDNQKYILNLLRRYNSLEFVCKPESDPEVVTEYCGRYFRG